MRLGMIGLGRTGANMARRAAGIAIHEDDELLARDGRTLLGQGIRKETRNV